MQIFMIMQMILWMHINLSIYQFIYLSIYQFIYYIGLLHITKKENSDDADFHDNADHTLNACRAFYLLLNIGLLYVKKKKNSDNADDTRVLKIIEIVL